MTALFLRLASKIAFCAIASTLALTANATVITSSGTLTSPDHTTFQFNITTAGSTSLHLAGSSDAYLILFSGADTFTAATFLGQNDDSGGGLNSLLSLNLAVGTYTSYITTHGTIWDGSGFSTGHNHLPMNYTLTITGDVAAAATTAEVPEPSAAALVGLALLALGATRRRAKRA